MLDDRRFCVAFLALVVAGSFALSRGEEPKPAQAVRVMVVTGGHPYDTSFESLFEGYKEIVAKVYPWDVAYKRDFRPSVDVLVLYNLTQEIDQVERKNLQDFVESGFASRHRQLLEDLAMVSGGDRSEVFPEHRGRYPEVDAHDRSTDVGPSGRRASDLGGAWSLTLGGRSVQGHGDLAGGEGSARNR